MAYEHCAIIAISPVMPEAGPDDDSLQQELLENKPLVDQPQAMLSSQDGSALRGIRSALRWSSHAAPGKTGGSSSSLGSTRSNDISGMRPGAVLSLDHATGQVLWRSGPAPGGVASLVLTPDVVVALSPPAAADSTVLLSGFHRGTGEILWSRSCKLKGGGAAAGVVQGGCQVEAVDNRIALVLSRPFSLESLRVRAVLVVFTMGALYDKCR